MRARPSACEDRRRPLASANAKHDLTPLVYGLVVPTSRGLLARGRTRYAAQMLQPLKRLRLPRTAHHSAAEGFVGHSPQGEAHEGTLTVTSIQASTAAWLRARHARGAHSVGAGWGLSSPSPSSAWAFVTRPWLPATSGLPGSHALARRGSGWRVPSSCGTGALGRSAPARKSGLMPSDFDQTRRSHCWRFRAIRLRQPPSRRLDPCKYRRSEGRRLLVDDYVQFLVGGKAGAGGDGAAHDDVLDAAGLPARVVPGFGVRAPTPAKRVLASCAHAGGAAAGPCLSCDEVVSISGVACARFSLRRAADSREAQTVYRAGVGFIAAVARVCAQHTVGAKGLVGRRR